MDGFTSTFVIEKLISLMVALLLWYMQRQVIDKLDDVVKAISRLDRTQAVHNEKFDNIDVKTALIREHQIVQDDRLTKIEKDIIFIQSKQ